MKKKNLIYLPALLLIASCGGSAESTESADTTAVEVVAEIEYGPLKTASEVYDTPYYRTINDIDTAADKGAILNFSYGEYSVPFPTKVLEAYNLQFLTLTNSTGELPEDISKLQNLTNLTLSNGGLTKLPESLSECQNLNSVSLSGCKSLDIIQALDVLKKCPNIERIDISQTNLTELPASIADFPKLKSISIGNNNLTVLPDWFYSLTTIDQIYLAGMETFDYAAFFNSAKAFPALRIISVQYCNLKGLPAVLNEYPVLETVRWRETWEGKDSDQIIAITDKETKKFKKVKVTWSTM